MSNRFGWKIIQFRSNQTENPIFKKTANRRLNPKNRYDPVYFFGLDRNFEHT